MLESCLHKIDAIQLFFLTTDDQTVAEFSTNGSDIAKMRQAASVSQSLLMFVEVERQLQHQKCLENQRPLIIASHTASLEHVISIDSLTPLEKAAYHLRQLLPAVEDELKSYEAEALHHIKEDLSSWWRARCSSYPTLATLARKYLGIQASSVASERHFSRAGRTLSKNRQSMADETLELLLERGTKFVFLATYALSRFSIIGASASNTAESGATFLIDKVSSVFGFPHSSL
ncbi:hypothetical protein RCL1_002993 [Eukaryota sp. TZLM3-RCL]